VRGPIASFRATCARFGSPSRSDSPTARRSEASRSSIEKQVDVSRRGAPEPAHRGVTPRSSSSSARWPGRAQQERHRCSSCSWASAGGATLVWSEKPSRRAHRGLPSSTTAAAERSRRTGWPPRGPVSGVQRRRRPRRLLAGRPVPRGHPPARASLARVPADGARPQALRSRGARHDVQILAAAGIALVATGRVALGAH
jgi:hypothetical protein